MIWQLIISEKTQRYLQLIELVKREQYTVPEMARQTRVSIRTVMRSLEELRQKGYVIKEKSWRIDRQCYPSYMEVHRKIIMADSFFGLFRQYLWQEASEEINYTKVKQLNQHLICLNLSANRKAGRLLGEPSLIFLLQLRYLRDFYYFEEHEIYQQMDRYYEDYPVSPLNDELYPDKELINRFIEEVNIQEKLSEFFFFDHMRYHFQSFTEFYHCHRNHQTVLYEEVKQASMMVDETIAWQSELLKNTFAVKLFDLFLGIRQGLPLAIYNSKWKQGAISESYYHLSKELKRKIPMLSNCRIDELALALRNIGFASHQVALTTTPTLEFSLLIQERFESFFPSD
ncbi:hypothetical protein IGI39_002501 [Enterococcus sp. AZ135]|uniref:hypothetical protein n=1 Tax=unclassified Enterococcus TaxID=2608891 RepID=UPI003F1EBE0D